MAEIRYCTVANAGRNALFFDKRAIWSGNRLGDPNLRFVQRRAFADNEAARRESPFSIRFMARHDDKAPGGILRVVR